MQVSIGQCFEMDHGWWVFSFILFQLASVSSWHISKCSEQLVEFQLLLRD